MNDLVDEERKMSAVIGFPAEKTKVFGLRHIVPTSDIPAGLAFKDGCVSEWYMPEVSQEREGTVVAGLRPVYGDRDVLIMLQRIHPPYRHGRFTDLPAFYSRWRPPVEQDGDVVIVALGTHRKLASGFVCVPVLVFPEDRHSYKPFLQFVEISALDPTWFLLLVREECRVV